MTNPVPTLHYNTGPLEDWVPPNHLGATSMRILTTQTVLRSTDPVLPLNIGAIVEYTGTLLRANPHASKYVLINDREGPLESIYLQTAMAFASGGSPHPDWRQCVAEHVTLLNSLHHRYPDHRFAYYARPRLPGFVDPMKPSHWGRITSKDRDRYWGGYLRAYAPIMEASRWLCPQQVYDAFDDADPRPRPSYIGDDHAYFTTASARNCTAFCREHYPDTPCISWVSAFGTNSQYSTPFKPIPIDELMEQQVVPCLDAGANGICVYGIGWPYRMATQRPTDPTYDAYREAFATSYFPDVAPSKIDWSSPAIHAELRTRIEDHTIAALSAIRTEIDRRHQPAGGNHSAPPPQQPSPTRVILDRARDHARALLHNIELLSADLGAMEGDGAPG